MTGPLDRIRDRVAPSRRGQGKERSRVTRPLVGDFLRPVGTSTLRPSAGSCDLGGSSCVAGRSCAWQWSAALALAGCASGDDDSSSATTSGGGSATTGSASGPAPGVTADSIKIGVTYVDTKALAAVNLNYDLGDHEATYKALFDDINAKGGINGRKIEPIFAPIDPSQPASSRRGVPQADRGRRRLPRHRVLPHRRP